MSACSALLPPGLAKGATENNDLRMRPDGLPKACDAAAAAFLNPNGPQLYTQLLAFAGAKALLTAQVAGASPASLLPTR